MKGYRNLEKFATDLERVMAGQCLACDAQIGYERHSDRRCRTCMAKAIKRGEYDWHLTRIPRSYDGLGEAMPTQVRCGRKLCSI